MNGHDADYKREPQEINDSGSLRGNVIIHIRYLAEEFSYLPHNGRHIELTGGGCGVRFKS